MADGLFEMSAELKRQTGETAQMFGGGFFFIFIFFFFFIFFRRGCFF